MKREPIMVQTRHVYDSYLDLRRLVHASAMPTCYVDEMDLASENTYVFTPINGEVLPHFRAFQGKRRARVIWWMLERESDPSLFPSLDATAEFVNGVWVSDRYFASLDSRLSYVKLAGHRGFGARSVQRNWDVCTLAYLWGRRKDVVDRLVELGYKIAPNAWGESEQNKHVATSHLMLNLHQYEGQLSLEPLRVAIAASYAIPVVSETFADVEALEYVPRVTTIENVPRMLEKLLQFPRMLAQSGEELHRKLCIETNFRREIEAAL